MAMAVAFLLLGFLLGLLTLAIAEGAALLWAIRSLTRHRSSPSDSGAPPLPVDPPPPPADLKRRQGFLWMLEQDKMPKASIKSNGKKAIVEVFPVKVLAKLEGHSLTLSAPDGSHNTIHLLDCTVVAVSASNLPSRKWAKRYPIKLERKESQISKGGKRTLSNTRTPTYIGEITLSGLSLGKLPPYLHRMRVLPRDLNELWAFEVDFEYSSGILLDIETRLEIREPELEKDIITTSLKDDSNGAVSSDVLDSIEQYSSQFRSSEASDSALKDNGDTDALRKSKSTGWTSTYMSRWKSILHSIADQVSQVPLSLAIKISSIRGTMRIHIKPPPSDRIWYGFTSMPEIEWELGSSVGDRKISNSHIASLIGNRIKASLHQSLVLPNCESIPISWMISDTDDWVPRKIAPFIWLHRERTETSARPPAGKTPGEASVSKAIAKTKSSPPVPSTRSNNESPKTCEDGSEQAEASTSWQSRLVSTNGAPLQFITREQLRMPLLSSSSSSSRDDRAVVVAARSSADEDAGDVKRKLRGGRRAKVMDLGRRVGGKLEEKGKHIVGKMRENARSNSLLLPDLERATTPATAPS
nr:unnamed protein product [Digitaria exilis]